MISLGISNVDSILSNYEERKIYQISDARSPTSTPLRSPSLNLPEINEVNRIKQNRSNRSLLSSC